MDLTVRSYNCLKREGIHTVGELVSRTEADLLDIRNFGQKSIDEVKIKLAGMGLSLKDSPAGFDPAAAALAYSDTDWNDDTDDSRLRRRSATACRRRPPTTPTTRRPSRSELWHRRLTMVHPDLGWAAAMPRYRRGPAPHRTRTGNRRRPGVRSRAAASPAGAPLRGPRSEGSDQHAHPTQGSPPRRLARPRAPDPVQPRAPSLFEHGKITTTETKAKRLRPLAEKLITSAKKGTLHSRREVLKIDPRQGRGAQAVRRDRRRRSRPARVATPGSPRPARARATTPRWRSSS